MEEFCLRAEVAAPAGDWIPLALVDGDAVYVQAGGGVLRLDRGRVPSDGGRWDPMTR